MVEIAKTPSMKISNFSHVWSHGDLSALVKRVFPIFDLVHSKLRNRLGTDKAANYCFYLLNKLN